MAWCALFPAHPPVSHLADPTREHVTSCFPHLGKSSAVCSCASALHPGPCQAHAFSPQERDLCSPHASAWRGRVNAAAEQHYPGAEPCSLQANNTDPRPPAGRVSQPDVAFSPKPKQSSPLGLPCTPLSEALLTKCAKICQNVPSVVRGIND